MKERPIPFSGEMVRAILVGKKTQTRRVVKPQPKIDPGFFIRWSRYGEEFHSVETRVGMSVLRCPYGAPGDHLWVRETFARAFCFQHDGEVPDLECSCATTLYRADIKSDADMEPKWTPSIHMPRARSRLTLHITDVRVERLQEISEEDAKAEGAPFILVPLAEEGPTPAGISHHGYRMGFSRLWDSINGDKPGRSWGDNPWVWAIKFERVVKA